MFQIVLAIPHFDNRDSICGWSYERLPYGYLTKACAVAIACRRWEGNGWEGSAKVVPYGATVDVLRAGVFGPTVAKDEPGPYGDYIPF